jgi:hypothetical protein
MAIDPQPPGSRTAAHPVGLALPSVRGGGTAGNARLTAATGAVLVALLAVIGVTLLRLSSLLWVHLFVGLLLIPPVLLKMASTGYRFARYYTSDAAYRRKGPPPLALRLIAPMVIATTLVVLVTGVALLMIGPSSRDTLLPIHKITFFVWAAFAGLHLLGHLPELPGLLGADYARPRAASSGSPALSGDVTGRAGRVLALGGALVAGGVLGVLFLPDFGAWLHSSAFLHHHHG